MGFRGQTSVEYLIMVGITVIIVLIAAASFLSVTQGMIQEYNAFTSFEGNLIEVIKK